MPKGNVTTRPPVKEWTPPTSTPAAPETKPEAPYFVAVENNGNEQRIPGVPIMNGSWENGQFAPSTPADVQTMRGLALYLDKYGGEGTDVVAYLTQARGLSLDTSLAVCLNITTSNLAKANAEKVGIEKELAAIQMPTPATVEQQLASLSVDGLRARHDKLTQENSSLDLTILGLTTTMPAAGDTQKALLEKQRDDFAATMSKNEAEMRVIEAKIESITRMNTLEASLITLANGLTAAQRATRTADAAQKTAQEALNEVTQRISKLGEDVVQKQQKLSTQFGALTDEERTLAEGKSTPEEIILPAIDEVGAPNFAAVKAYIAARNELINMRKELSTLTQVEQPNRRNGLTTANGNLEIAQNAEKTAQETLVSTQDEYAVLTKDGVCAEILKLRGSLGKANSGVATATAEQTRLNEALAEVNARIARLGKLESRFEAMSGYEEAKQIRRAVLRAQQPTTAAPASSRSAAPVDLARPTVKPQMPWLRRAGQWILERSPTLRTWWAGVMPPAPAAATRVAVPKAVVQRTEQPAPTSAPAVKLNPLWFNKLERYFSDIPSARNYLSVIADGGALTGAGFKNADELNAALASRNLSDEQAMELYKYVMVDYRNRNAGVDGLPTEDEIKAISTVEQAAHVSRLCAAAVSRNFGVDNVDSMTATEKEAVNSYTKSAGMLLRAELRADELWDSIYEKLYAYAKKNGKASAVPLELVRGGTDAGRLAAPQAGAPAAGPGMANAPEPATAGIPMVE